MAKTWSTNLNCTDTESKIRNKSQRVTKTRASNKDKIWIGMPSDIHSYTSQEKEKINNNGTGGTVYIGFASNMPVRASRRIIQQKSENQNNLIEK